MLVSVLAAVIVRSSSAGSATLSNVALPLDQYGQQLITGEASSMAHGGAYYFYFNNWGTCPGVDCCADPRGCATCCFTNFPNYTKGCASPTNGSDPYGMWHTVQGYKTTDFKTWTNMGVALPLSSRKPGTEFRPCVVYNPKSKLFVMWYEDRGAAESGYAVATSATPEGPFTPSKANITMPGRGRTGDYNIFVDDDGTGYHVRTGFDVVKLNDDFDGPDSHVSAFQTPKSSEGPTMFKRDGTYYITAGTGCCACIGGSSIYVMASNAVTGPWQYLGDVGSVVGHIFDPHSPDNFVTKAQGSAVVIVGNQTIYLGNQWNSGLKLTPPGPRNHDLLYWGVFEFEPATVEDNTTLQKIKQMVWHDSVDIIV